MFQELKKCKTLKELFSTLGVAPFEKAAYILLIVWCLLPLISTVHRMYWAVVAINEMQQRHAVENGYKLAMQFVGSLSLYVAIFYLISRISVLGKGIWYKLKQQPWNVFLILMLFWSCISTLLSDDLNRSFFGSLYRFEGLQTYFYYAGAFVCALMVSKANLRKNILFLFICVANIVSLLIILQDFGNVFLNKCFLEPGAGMFFHLNHAGHYLNLGIVCSMGAYLYEERRIYSFFFVFSMAFQIYGILVNSTLGSFIGTCCALIMILVFFVRKNGKFAIRMMMPVIIVILLVVASYMGYVPTSSGEDMKANFELLVDNGKEFVEDGGVIENIGHRRVFLWKQGLLMIPKRPIFGYGPEQLDKELSEEMWVDRPDNEFIQHAVFLGVPGLLFYITSLVLLFIRQWRNIKELDITTLIAAGCVIAYLVSSLFGNSMFYTTCYLYIFLAFSSVSEIEFNDDN